MKVVSKIDQNTMKRPYSFIGFSRLRNYDGILKGYMQHLSVRKSICLVIKSSRRGNHGTLLVLSVYLAFTD